MKKKDDKILIDIWCFRTRRYANRLFPVDGVRRASRFILSFFKLTISVFYNLVI